MRPWSDCEDRLFGRYCHHRDREIIRGTCHDRLLALEALYQACLRHGDACRAIRRVPEVVESTLDRVLELTAAISALEIDQAYHGDPETETEGVRD